MKKLGKFCSVVFMLLAFICTVNVNAANGGNNGNGVGNYDGDKKGNTFHSGNQGNNKPVGNTGTKKDKPKPPKPPKKDKGPKKDKKTDSVPLDGGLSILLLGAAAFGVKKLRK